MIDLPRLRVLFDVMLYSGMQYAELRQVRDEPARLVVVQFLKVGHDGGDAANRWFRDPRPDDAAVRSVPRLDVPGRKDAHLSEPEIFD